MMQQRKKPKRKPVLVRLEPDVSKLLEKYKAKEVIPADSTAVYKLFVEKLRDWEAANV